MSYCVSVHGDALHHCEVILHSCYVSSFSSVASRFLIDVTFVTIIS